MDSFSFIFMNIMFYIFSFALGFLFCLILFSIFLVNRIFGTLIVTLDEEDLTHYLSLDMDKHPSYLKKYKFVVFKIRNNNFVDSQK